jgi:hypothetical protein
MFLIIAGAALVGCVGLGALYDYIARRRGRNESFGSSGDPSMTAPPSISAQAQHDYGRP